MAVVSQTPERSTRHGWSLGQRRRALLGRLLLHLILIALGILFLIPFVWMFSTSLKVTGSELVFPPQWIPNPVEWGNYRAALIDQVPFLSYFKNTLIITVGATVGDVLMASLTAYSFARLSFPGRNILFMFTLATLMLPGIVTVIPTFLLMRTLHWLDTFLPLTVPFWAGGTAFSIFLYRQFFLTIPRDLDEAARMDGAGPLRIWWTILVPLSGAVMATVTILDVLYNWNDFFNPLIYLNSESNYTMALGLGQYAIGHQGTAFNLQMAAAVVMTLPIILLFFVAQRYFMRGIVTTGLAAR